MKLTRGHEVLVYQISPTSEVLASVVSATLHGSDSRNMPKWTQGVEEYSRVHQIVLEACQSQYCKVTLTDKRELFGWLVGSSWGTDAVINHTRGLGPVAKSMWCEMRLLTENGSQTINIDAMEVQSIHQASAPQPA